MQSIVHWHEINTPTRFFLQVIIINIPNENMIIGIYHLCFPEQNSDMPCVATAHRRKSMNLKGLRFA